MNFGGSMEKYRKMGCTLNMRNALPIMKMPMAIISMARAFRESTATAGPSNKRGRKPLTWDEKLAKYCSDTLKLDHDQMEQAAVMLRKLAKQVA